MNPPKDAWALFLDYDALNIFTGEWHQTCMKGGYTGTPCKTSYAPGDLDVQCTVHNGLTEAIQIATEAEIVMGVVGLDLSQETGRQAFAKLIFKEFNQGGRLPMT
ncbi:hypothetical protein NE237_016332 [Protea cynaroides]|uniref:Uncharacterized protein n=1 Tax=Protea cynaroides TaxID=273540 RepID=A0A9Q0JS93_9MAGN|nr:hypothetical protein NE237_016332 [Protea cynaroides]